MTMPAYEDTRLLPYEELPVPFRPFGKIPRLSREIIITEKIDGTNASIYIAPNCAPVKCASGRELPFHVGSRTRWIYPENDNHGFAAWAYDNATELLKLGQGHHFGEWWGKGINRRYGLEERRFSLFNVSKWNDPTIRPACCHVVPTLWKGLFNTAYIEAELNNLALNGSVAAPGFMKPEGIVVSHIVSGHLYKKTIEADEQPKNMKIVEEI